MMELNLSKEKSLNLLDLRKNNIEELCMKKPELTNCKGRCAAVIDFSGSMEKKYKDGTVQALLERIFPLAIQFDDNGEMEVWIFSNDFHRLPNMTMDNFYGYVEREIFSNPAFHMGRTKYSPVMKDVVVRYMKEEPANLPNYVAYVTDGNCSDKNETTHVITEASKAPIFWQFIGLRASERFTYLETLDTMKGRYVDNANFFEVVNISETTDDELYALLLKEYPEWLKNPSVQNMIQNPKIPNIDGTNDTNGENTKKGIMGKLFGR